MGSRPGGCTSKTSGASGTVIIGTDTVQFYATESNVWAKADRSHWITATNPTAADVIGNKWLKVPTTAEKFKTLASFANYEGALSKLLTGTYTKGEPAELAGQASIILVDSTDGRKLWIATMGQPLPLQGQLVATAAAADTMLVTYSQWGSATVASVPAQGDTIDINSLPAA